jgi:hypothetical protein
MNQQLHDTIWRDDPKNMPKVEGFEVVNLDCFSIDPMDLARMSRIFTLYAVYCERLAIAMQHRLDGEINVAMELEKKNDATYNELPAWAKW